MPTHGGDGPSFRLPDQLFPQGASDNYPQGQRRNPPEWIRCCMLKPTLPRISGSRFRRRVRRTVQILTTGETVDCERPISFWSCRIAENSPRLHLSNLRPEVPEVRQDEASSLSNTPTRVIKSASHHRLPRVLPPTNSRSSLSDPAFTLRRKVSRNSFPALGCRLLPGSRERFRSHGGPPIITFLPESTAL